MDIKATRHTSTNLEEINERIERILKDPSTLENDKSIDLYSLTLPELKAFAEQGGLGACVSKTDVLAETSEDLMYLSGERIIVLKHIEDDFYLGYCEGVIGRFNAENVHFVELDPRVLDSLDGGGLDMESLGVRSSMDHGDIMTDERLRPRRSMQSYQSSTSEQYSSPTHDISNGTSHGKQAWLGRSSMDSLLTTSTTSGMSHLYDPARVYRSSYLKSTTVPETMETYDTSAFNDNYSNESDDENNDYAIPDTSKHTTATTTNKQRFTPYDTTPIDNSNSNTFSLTSATRGSRLAKYQATFDSDDGDDEDNADHLGDDSGISSKNSSKPSISPTNQGGVAMTSMPSVDENGFIINKMDMNKQQRSPSSKSNLSVKSMKHYREREVKWLSIVSKLDAGSVKKDAKLKKLVRSGIPTSVRARVWQFLAGSGDYQKQGKNQLDTLINQPYTAIYDVIDRDIPRCYPDHTLFKDEHSQGQADLRTILRAYAQYNPQLEYCQGMGRLAGCMLMHMPLEDAFWLLVCTIDRYMNGYFTPELSQLRIDAYIIGQLLKDHEPKLAQHLENNDVTPIMYIAQWFLTAFTMTLPWNSVLRVWDVFYFEGVKVFYRISLAILQLCKDHLLQSCPTNSEILAFLLHIPHDYLTADVLLDTAFHIKLSKTDIERYAKKATLNGADAMGLPFEHGLKNLRVGTNLSSNSIGSTLKDKIKKKSSSMNLKDQATTSSPSPPLPTSLSSFGSS
ncbi:rab-GTPase-TBC domain-containing protein [Halteromyces radiatus]|uniref:rab-GTPase-TBC domain-containing protein n=1 Tax=Halteromyces radiatus TaxID=101107 RepID=UPI0022202E9A|nr:rab-GTPase-TBC domain-containing protein [Halteromyces radiatus]KAI8080026.1 rab-GTPase-TBC domain-containing protein [Halteromyces radiatus]